MKVLGKMCFKIILRHKKTRVSLSLQEIQHSKNHRRGDQIDPLPSAVLVLNEAKNGNCSYFWKKPHLSARTLLCPIFLMCNNIFTLFYQQTLFYFGYRFWRYIFKGVEGGSFQNFPKSGGFRFFSKKERSWKNRVFFVLKIGSITFILANLFQCYLTLSVWCACLCFNNLHYFHQYCLCFTGRILPY